MLDRYGPEEAEYARFDSNLRQGLAWKRLENGLGSPDDVEWVAHEISELHHEQKFGSGYTEAHDLAQKKFDGNPWKD